jgi:hypothetical protein
LSTPTGSILATVALVVGIPLACLTGVALYGRALTESDVAVGTLVSPEVARQRLLEARARFVAMTPAEHLAAARAALAAGQDPARRRFAGSGQAMEHLAAIPAGAPERAGADGLLAEIARRRREALRPAAERIVERVREQGDPRGADGRRLAAMRAGLAGSLAGRLPAGVGGAAVEGEGGDAGVTLRLERRRCDGALLDAIVSPEGAAGLRALGFRAVRCANDGGALAL